MNSETHSPTSIGRVARHDEKDFSASCPFRGAAFLGGCGPDPLRFEQVECPMEVVSSSVTAFP